MIYLIITTCIQNRHGLQMEAERKERYLYAISETLKHLPAEIQPIIVENNGKRETYLDHFEHNGKKVPVVYTDNNKFTHFKSKGMNELLDLHAVIDKQNIQEDDIIIKLTGRYRVLSPAFFHDVLQHQTSYDAFVKFYNVCELKFETYDCVLGMYAIRVRHFLLNRVPGSYASAEIAFARYVRLCGAKYKEMLQLDLECQFADDNRILVV
jgi:hypothetical protein